jgi:hypothetical protein
MIYIIYIFSGVFLVLSAAMIIAYAREKHVGLFLMGIVYGTSGLLAIEYSHWWPLAAGFVLAWMLRFLGLEPKVEPKAEGGDQKSEEIPEQGK